MPTEQHPTLEILRNANIRYFAASRFFSAMATRMLPVVVAWHVFAATGSALYLGFIGIAQFLPVLPMSLIGGAVADAHDRRRVAMLAQVGLLACGTVLWAVSRYGDAPVWLVLSIVFLVSVCAAFDNPARAALLPTLVDRRLFINAVTLMSSVVKLGWMSAPVFAGFIIDLFDVSAAYAVNAILVFASVVMLSRVHPPELATEKTAISPAAIREGISFVRHRPVILGAMSLDMFAVIFASATALLPIFASDILDVGPRGYGILSASLEIGTFLMAVILLVLPPIVRPGRALLFAVAAYGVATILFGLSRSFPLSVLAYMLAGMADEISMVCRSTLIQLSTPDALRGRVTSVNMIFINASNQLGVAESGLLAAVTNATFSVVFGGAACLGILAGIAAKVPSLAKYRVTDEEA